MDEDRERDDMALRPLVRQFRRVARLLAADPLRLLRADPLRPLTSLGAPVEALIAAAPLEGLRNAIAPPAADGRSAVSRARVRTPGAAPAGAPGGHVRLSTRQDARVARASEQRPPAVGTDRRAPPTPTVAERRVAARRELADGRVPPRATSPSLSPAPPTTRGPTGLPWPEPPAGGRGLPGRDAVPTTAAAAHLLGVRAAQPRTSPEWEAAARTTATTLAPLLGIDDRSSVAADAALGIDADGPAAERWRAGLEPESIRQVDVPTREESGSRARPRPEDRDSPAEAGRLTARPVPRLAGPAEAALPLGAAPRARSSKREEGPVLTDDFFEALYRDGVDVSWP